MECEVNNSCVVLIFVKGVTETTENGFRYLDVMKRIWGIILVLTSVYGCEKQDVDCNDIWHYDAKEVAAYASVDTGWLALTVYNPGSINGMVLSQESLVGDFEISINEMMLQHAGLEAQFRMEVTSAGDDPSISGVAVQNGEAYAYVGLNQNSPQVRLISSHRGSIHIERSGSVITSAFRFGTVNLTVSDTVGTQDMSVRIVLGSLEPEQGKVRALLDDFMVQVQDPNSRVKGDGFNCAQTLL